jgi:hypothetical protein
MAAALESVEQRRAALTVTPRTSCTLVMVGVVEGLADGVSRYRETWAKLDERRCASAGWLKSSRTLAAEAGQLAVSSAGRSGRYRERCRSAAQAGV